LNLRRPFDENHSTPDGPTRIQPSVTGTGFGKVSSMVQEMPSMKQMVNLCNVIRVCVIVHKRKKLGQFAHPPKVSPG
jgi:hypothetical protein